MKNPCQIIHLNPTTWQIDPPTLLLKTRSFKTLGVIPYYDNWNISLIGNGMDEISFDVHKMISGMKCPLWDELIDLRIINVKGFGNFEISVSYSDSSETIKSVHGVSLETELSQIPIYELHINDEQDTDPELSTHFDQEGNFIPTVFYDPDRPEYSLLNRIIADKAPHWSIGYVTPYITFAEGEKPELAKKFQRTYTFDGSTIYEILTGEIAAESNVIFIFDSLTRRINCYSLIDCVDPDTQEVLASSIGNDTMVCISKKQLANELTLSSNKDEVKNCFRVIGGDDVITDMVRVANLNGSNYIYQFSNLQYQDMSKGLVDKLESYQAELDKRKDQYYGETGIFTRLCKAYDELYLKTSGMMPNVKTETTAKDEYDFLTTHLNGSTVAVTAINNYDDNNFVGVTNNVISMAQILVDSRYEVSIIDGTIKYTHSSRDWKAKFRIKKKTDDTEVYPIPANEAASSHISVKISDDELEFAKQKLQKALSKGDMLEIDFDISKSPYVNADGSLNTTEIEKYFEQYSLNRLKSFEDGYNSCLSIIMTFGQKETGTIEKQTYDKYHTIYEIVAKVHKHRQTEVDSINSTINALLAEQAAFQKEINFKNWLGEYYNEFCSYRREDTYQNDNYISDGLSDKECLDKAKELLQVATKEAKKACVLQRTVDVQLSNLFAIPEFEPLYESFALFNYIRVKTDDELLKLRIIQIDFNGSSPEAISVVFSDKIESLDGTVSDLQSIINQASDMATSFSSTVLQAKQGSEAHDRFMEMYSYGLNASNTLLRNSDTNEVTYGPYGILCKNMGDEGFYGEKQLRIIGNGMYLTDDNWQTVKMAVGEVKLEESKSPVYGIIADTIVGNLIIGDNIVLSGSIQSANYKRYKEGTRIDLANGHVDIGGALVFKDGDLSVSGEINAHQIYANGEGMIAGFKLADASLFTEDTMPLADGEVAPEIGPCSGISANALKYAFWAGETNRSTGYIGQDGLTPSSDAKFSVDHDGNIKIGKNFSFQADKGTLSISGDITANTLTATTGGTIGPFTINANSLYRGSQSLGTVGDGCIYLGTQGLSLSDKFVYNTKGGSLSIKGTITATEGQIGPFHITKTSLWKQSPSFGSIDSSSIYLGDDGFSVGGRFKFNSKTNELSLSGDLIIGLDAKIGYKPYNINLPGMSSIGSQFIIDTDVVFPQQTVFQSSVYYSSSLFCYDQVNIYKTINVPSQIKAGTVDEETNKIILDNKVGIRGRETRGNAKHHNICRTEQKTDPSLLIGSTGLVTYVYSKNKVFTNTQFSSASDRRFKTNLKQLDDRYLTFFDNISPTLFNWASHSAQDQRQCIGYIAQEVSDAMAKAGISDEENGIVNFTYEPTNDDMTKGAPQPTYSLTYEYIDTVATYALQDARKRIVELEREINELKMKIK